MNEQDIERIKKVKDDKEMMDIIDKIIKIQRQIDHPDRNGMIETLRDAQQIASNEIAQSIHQHGGYVYSKAWSDFSNEELYSMLPKYQQGLINHGIAKFGKGELERLIRSLYKKEG